MASGGASDEAALARQRAWWSSVRQFAEEKGLVDGLPEEARDLDDLVASVLGGRRRPQGGGRRPSTAVELETVASLLEAMAEYGASLRVREAALEAVAREKGERHGEVARAARRPPLRRSERRSTARAIPGPASAQLQL